MQVDLTTSSSISPEPVTSPGQAPLTAMVAVAPPGEQKQMLGERLFPLIQKKMLIFDNSQILKMIESSEVLTREVRAAVNQLIKHI